MTLSRKRVAMPTVSLNSSILKLPSLSTNLSRLMDPKLQHPPSGKGCSAQGFVDTKGLQYSALW